MAKETIQDNPIPQSNNQTDTRGGLKPLTKSIHKNDAISKKHHFFIKDWHYYTIHTDKQGHEMEVQLSNFVMEIIYFFPDGTNNAKRLLKIQSAVEKIELIELFAKDFSISNFNSALRSKGNYHFFGSNIDLSHILDYIFQNETKAEQIDVLGYQPAHNIYAFSNGILNSENEFVEINDFGIVKDGGKTFYLPAFSFLNEANEALKNERDFIYRPGKITFTRWTELLYRMYADRGAIGASFVIATIFRDIIFADFGHFPFLYLFGSASTGKTTYVDCLTKLFYKEHLGMSLSNDTTSKAMGRRLAQLRNAPVYLKEFKNSKAERANNYLLSAYDGAGYDRAEKSNDNRTHQTGVYCSIIIDGNEIPEENTPVFSRTVLLKFEKGLFNNETTLAKEQYEAETSDGTGQILKAILQHREYIQSKYATTYRNIKNRLKTAYFSDKERLERNIEHASLLLTPVILLSNKLEFGFDVSQLETWICESANYQNEILQDSNEVTEFWNTTGFLATNGRIKNGVEYIIKSPLKGHENVLCIRFDELYKSYQKCQGETRSTSIAKQTLKQMLKEQTYFIPAKAENDNTWSESIDGKRYTLFDLTKLKAVYSIQLL